MASPDWTGCACNESPQRKISNYCSIGGIGTLQNEQTIREDGRKTRAMLRIAVPVWGRVTRTPEPATPEDQTREEFETLLKTTLRAEELRRTGLDSDERRQLAITRKIRSALYGQPDYA